MRHDRSVPLNAREIGRHGGTPPWVEYVIRGVTMGMPKQPVPSIDLVPVHNAMTYGGRYFPKYNAILIYDNPDHDLTRTTLIHEMAHWKTYCTQCGSHGGHSKCGYVGDHNKTFYDVLVPLYRAFGAPRESIKLVEAGYPYPWRNTR